MADDPRYSTVSARQIPHDARSGTLRVRALAIVDYYDGPLSGIAQLSGHATLWRFRLIAGVMRTDAIDDRLFEFAPLPTDLPETLRTALETADRPLLTPDADVAAAIDDLMDAEIPAELIVSAPRFDIVEQAWLAGSPKDYY